MKKIITTTLAIATALMCTIPVNAAENTTTAQSDISLYVPNDPVYTVTVPETITLDPNEITNVPITASNVKYIPEGKKISVTFTKGIGTTSGRLYLQGTNEETGKGYLMTLKIAGTAGEFKNGALEKQIKGMELVDFTENGTENYQLYPVSLDYPQYVGKDSNLAIQQGVKYSGSMVYGIELVDTE